MDADLDPLLPRPLDLPRAVIGAERGSLDGAKIFAAPDDPAQWQAWREALAAWRTEARSGFDDSLYQRDDLRWVRSCVTVAQIWLYDELFYSFAEQRFTPQRLLSDAARFGGFDGIVLWHAYPLIGIDERNQWDYYRLVPGLRDLVDALHAAGVRVFLDYNPWDTGTRRAGSDADELAALVRELDADGVFLDTLKEGDPTLLDQVEQSRSGVAFEGESTLPLARLADHPVSWAQWFADSAVPGVIRSRWFERRHQLHHVRRWHRDHSEELRSAWLNGVGVMCWEVVFGVWVGWSPRDAATLRVMSRAQRALVQLLTEGAWTPLVDLGPVADGVFGGVYELDGQRLLCLVNTSGVDAMVRLESPGLCIRGGLAERSAVAVPAYGIGGAWWPGDADTSWLAEDIAQVADGSFPYRVAERVHNLGEYGHRSPLEGGWAAMARGYARGVALSPGVHHLTVRYRCRETGMYGVAPFVGEWKPLPPRLHDLRTVERTVTVGAVTVGVQPVTREEFATFVRATGHPAGVCAAQPWWLADGVDDPDAPATEVGLDDARAYAAWSGGRLPTEDEWQLALGDPAASRGTRAVWEWTESEHSDGRTRFSILKGGSEHRSEGSSWYFDGGVRGPDFAAMYLRPGFGLDRSEQIGFRVAWDTTFQEPA